MDGGGICKSCGNTGTDITGSPCVCKLPPEWQKEVHRLRLENADLRKCYESGKKCNDDMERAMLAAEAERDRLQGIVNGLAERVAGQSEILSRKAVTEPRATSVEQFLTSLRESLLAAREWKADMKPLGSGIVHWHINITEGQR